jgi:sodium-type flagellar protein MotY
LLGHAYLEQQEWVAHANKDEVQIENTILSILESNLNSNRVAALPRLVFCCLSFLFFFFSHITLAQVFSTSVTESQWSVESGPFNCKLSHKIDGFGTWVINRKASQAETAFLVINKTQTEKKNIHLTAGQYKILTAPPAWKQQQAPELIGELSLSKMDADLLFPPAIVSSVLKTLEKSTAVMLVSQDSKPLRVQIQPYRFKDAHKQYQACLNQLITYSFEQITRNTLYYQADETALSATNKGVLDKLVRYMRADPNRVLGVLIDGHSDAQADPAVAESLAKNQADWVAAYLKEKGVAEDKLVVRSHADKYPVANNFLAKDKARNRRVTVRLEDETIRQKNAEKVAELKKQAEEKAAAASAAASSAAPPPEFGDKLPIELELEKMVEGQDLEKVSPSELP